MLLVKLFLSHLLYYLGDLISRTTMRWGRGYGYSFYNRIMAASVNLDPDGKLWKKSKMSILNFFRSLRNKNKDLQKSCEKMLRENFELLKEIRELKHVLYKDSFIKKKKARRKK